MKKRICLTVAIAIVVLISLFLLWNGENELLNESNATEIPLDGVSLNVFATKHKVEYTIESTEIDYIVYDGYNKSMRLEMLEDGKWYVVGDGKIGYDEPAPISPNKSHSVDYKWKEIYEHNMKSGEYRLVYTFWAMPLGEDGTRHQTNNYVVIKEFTID